MARATILGNGSILVGLDQRGQVRDFYAPFVGHSNHVSGASGSYIHRIGVYVDGSLSWLDDPAWEVTFDGCAEMSGGSFRAVNTTAGIVLSSTHIVHNEQNIFLRSFTVTNTHADAREVCVFFSQQFRIAESRRGDTGFYDPRVGAIIHYKGSDVFLVYARTNNVPFSDYNIGLFGIEGREGTYVDAYDGVLEKNPIEHGSVDSIIGMKYNLPSNGKQDIEYWICYGSTIDEVHDLHDHVLKETPPKLITSTQNYWLAWAHKEEYDLSPLSRDVQDMFTHSLVMMRVHTDNGGGIIASSDTDMLHHGRDTYSYVWPRDGAFVANAFDVAGYPDVSKRFYEFITKRLERGGYLMHKYRSDGTLGSSWHPWLWHGVPELPIQEDETAIVLFMLWRHYEHTKDVEFIESLYNTFIEPASKFLGDFIEAPLGLPMNSYDLWEEKFGISTYTASCVYGALMASTRFAGMLGKEEQARTYLAIAQRMRSAILEHLFDAKRGVFIKQVRVQQNDEVARDEVVDISSLFGPVYFGVIDADDERCTKMLDVVYTRLCVTGNNGGCIRYEGDNYYKLQDSTASNPWAITTLFLAHIQISRAKKIRDLKNPELILEWIVQTATTGGMLPEQINPQNGSPLSATPLVWSHACFVETVIYFIEKYRELQVLVEKKA